MQSQILGTASAVRSLLQFGLQLGAQSGQARLFEYVLAHPDRVVLDEREIIFATFARKTTRASEGFRENARAGRWPRSCWEGPCVSTNSSRLRCEMRDKSLVLLEQSRMNADEVGSIVAPLLWHANGRSEEFLDMHPTCWDLYRRFRRRWFF